MAETEFGRAARLATENRELRNEVWQLQQEAALYEAMKEGVGRRITGLETKMRLLQEDAVAEVACLERRVAELTGDTMPATNLDGQVGEG